MYLDTGPGDCVQTQSRAPLRRLLTALALASARFHIFLLPKRIRFKNIYILLQEDVNDLRCVRRHSHYKTSRTSFLTIKRPAEGQNAKLKYLKREYGSQMLAQAEVKNHIKHPERLVTESVSLIHSRSVCLLVPRALCHRRASILRCSIPNDLLFTILS